MSEDPPVHQQERSCLSGRPRLGQSSRRSRTQVLVSGARGLDRQELDRNMIEGKVAYPSQGLWAGDKCSGEEEETRKKWNQGGPVDGGHLHKLYVGDGCHAANTSFICSLQITLKFDLPVTVSILYNNNPHKVCHPWIIFNLKLLDLRRNRLTKYNPEFTELVKRPGGKGLDIKYQGIPYFYYLNILQSLCQNKKCSYIPMYSQNLPNY